MPRPILRAIPELLRETALPAPERDNAIKNAELLVLEIEASGVKLIVTHDLNYIAAFYESAGWRLSKTLDPRFWSASSGPDKTIAVLTYRDGRPAGASCMRWLWLHESLGNEMRSLRFFYGDHVDEASNPSRCVITAQSADVIFGCPIVYACGWHSDDKEGDQYGSWRLVRLSQILAAVNWYWSWLVSISEIGIARQVERRVGWPTIEASIMFDVKQRGEIIPHYLLLCRRDRMRELIQRPEYGVGANSLAAPMPLFGD